MVVGACDFAIVSLLDIDRIEQRSLAPCWLVGQPWQRDCPLLRLHLLLPLARFEVDCSKTVAELHCYYASARTHALGLLVGSMMTMAVTTACSVVEHSHIQYETAGRMMLYNREHMQVQIQVWHLHW